MPECSLFRKGSFFIRQSGLYNEDTSIRVTKSNVYIHFNLVTVVLLKREIEYPRPVTRLMLIGGRYPGIAVIRYNENPAMHRLLRFRSAINQEAIHVHTLTLNEFLTHCFHQFNSITMSNLQCVEMFSLSKNCYLLGFK